MPYVRELRVKYCKRKIPNATLPEGPIAGPAEAAKFFIHMLKDEPIERLVALFLNARNEPLAFKQIGQGTVDHCSAYPAEIARGALLANAVCVIVAHNHPSGHTEPSPQDITFTRKVKEALDPLNIVLHDSIIVGDSAYASLRELGLLPQRLEPTRNPVPGYPSVPSEPCV